MVSFIVTIMTGVLAIVLIVVVAVVLVVVVGCGIRNKRTGFHTMIGFGNERIMWRGNDAIGEITFPKSQSNFVTAKVGVMKDIKNLTIKFDADPIRNYVQFGLGLNF